MHAELYFVFVMHAPAREASSEEAFVHSVAARSCP